MSDGAGKEVDVTLIHHFVGVMVGVVDTGESYLLQIQFRRVASPSQITGKENDEAGYNRHSLVTGALRNLAGLPRKLAMCCFMIRFYVPHRQGPLAGEQIEGRRVHQIG